MLAIILKVALVVITVIECSGFVALRVLTLAASVRVLLGPSLHVVGFLLYSIMITSLYVGFLADSKI